MASQALRADVTLDVTPPPIRVVAGARVGLFFNFGHAVGPAVFVEALRPVGVRRLPFPFFLGGTLGYLHTEIGGAGSTRAEPARLENRRGAGDGAGARARPASAGFEVSAEVGAGVMVARTRLTAVSRRSVRDDRPCLRARRRGWSRGRLHIETRPPLLWARYLRSELGRTSQGDGSPETARG